MTSYTEQLKEAALEYSKGWESLRAGFLAGAKWREEYDRSLLAEPEQSLDQSALQSNPESAEGKWKHHWTYCPECGSQDYEHVDYLGKGSRQCKDCGQEWWTDVDYTDTMRKIVSRLQSKPE